MTNYIHKLRQKPLKKRKQYAIIASGCITAVIALIWVATLPARLASQDNTAAAAAANAGSPLQDISQNVSQGYQQLKQSINNEPAVSPTPSSTYETDGVMITDPSGKNNAATGQ